MSQVLAEDCAPQEGIAVHPLSPQILSGEDHSGGCLEAALRQPKTEWVLWLLSVTREAYLLAVVRVRLGYLEVLYTEQRPAPSSRCCLPHSLLLFNPHCWGGWNPKIVKCISTVVYTTTFPRRPSQYCSVQSKKGESSCVKKEELELKRVIHILLSFSLVCVGVVITFQKVTEVVTWPPPPNWNIRNVRWHRGFCHCLAIGDSLISKMSHMLVCLLIVTVELDYMQGCVFCVQDVLKVFCLLACWKDRV